MPKPKNEYLPAKPVVDFLYQYMADKSLLPSNMQRKLGWSSSYFRHLMLKSTYIGENKVKQLCSALNVTVEDIFNREGFPDEIYSYPIDILRWLATKEGKAEVLRCYIEHLEKQKQQQIEALTKEMQ